LSEAAPRNDAQQELKKRRREVFWILPLAVLFLLLTWLEVRLFGFSQTLPFEHSIFFLGLVNFNIIVFLFLFFLIFRNVVKVFAERPRGIFGSSLK
jgi:two-component system nitrogen regulation sensor histidine kinase NtrY